MKNIATYGALLLTTMVVIRAGLMENETNDVSFLYERAVEDDFISSNAELRDANNFIPEVLVASLKTTTDLNITQSKQRPTYTAEEELAYTASSLTIPEDFPVVNEEESQAQLSLERRSTINSNLSALFPRERINARPSTELER